MEHSDSWEALRQWHVVRKLVYYLTENLVPQRLITDRDVVDFSCGLGDLSRYILQHSPRSLRATSPDQIPTPKPLGDSAVASFTGGVDAKQITSTLGESSVDLFVARMVFQFPTVEHHYIDVDGMLQQIMQVLRPGGKLIICSHEYTELIDEPESWNLGIEEYFSLVKERKGSRERGLIELIQTIGIPPREGVHGQTGFGLKALMCVDSFVSAGFLIEHCAEIEDFTFPLGLQNALQEDRIEEFADLSEKVFAIKQKHILSNDFRDKYQRPSCLQKILREISALHEFVTMPIFSVQARKPG